VLAVDNETLHPLYRGFIIVDAMDDGAAFEEVEVLRRDFTGVVPVVICGNKCDLEEGRVVSKVEGERFPAKLSAMFFETSALANINIEKAFKALVKDTWKQSGGSSAASSGLEVTPKKGKGQ
jgi:GTPase SAR1 family protein